MQQSLKLHFSKVRFEKFAKYMEKTFQISVKMWLVSTCMSKSKQLLNSHNTLFIYFIYRREWFQQQTEFTAS